ncbi:MAG: hypothetical protein LBT63_00525 [Holosporaceae bacterium]|jgi:hypothetical protein|nr:hypothetical protein [Holosporaceae bacterium]
MKKIFCLMAALAFFNANGMEMTVSGPIAEAASNLMARGYSVKVKFEAETAGELYHIIGRNTASCYNSRFSLEHPYLYYEKSECIQKWEYYENDGYYNKVKYHNGQLFLFINIAEKVAIIAPSSIVEYSPSFLDNNHEMYGGKVDNILNELESIKQESEQSDSDASSDE